MTGTVSRPTSSQIAWIPTTMAARSAIFNPASTRALSASRALATTAEMGNVTARMRFLLRF